MGKHTAAIIISLSALVLLGILAYTQLEIYPRQRARPPAPEAQANRYLALDRWLNRAGVPFRAANRGNPALITAGDERLVFIQASRFDWESDTWEQLEPWVRSGGSLVISMDSSSYEALAHPLAQYDEGLYTLLDALGIEEIPDTGDYGFYPDGSEPDLDLEVAFTLVDTPSLQKDDDMNTLTTLKDHKGIIRLVQVSRGRGTVTVTGDTPFLLNQALGKEANARLAWSLLHPRDAGGLLFIRGRRRQIVPALFGRLVERGNPVPLLVSALALIALGLWMVIPLFGVPLRDDEKPGRPLRERFLAEGRFLKKHGALGTYQAVYLREIFRRLQQREGLDQGDDLNRRFVELWKEAALPGSPRPGDILAGTGTDRRRLVKTVDTLTVILEKL